ncbi:MULTISPECIES: hypothetical protein [unclassified Rhizobium]|uniref:hypothetical protein n=1 Tax=unclassified Rhizobium TaxID=2613769 RepID=UPI0007F0D3F8|nr:MULTISPECIES: hypothetical protein [unclassified Rhizobium]ANK84174.1 hypothetical protein AMK02_CH00529 [Rhizobium sp. N731]ANL14422.1 hypothetical protein AMJ97_CH00529 [Rhizobium sp. N1314]
MRNLLLAVTLGVMVGNLGVAQAEPHACPNGFLDLQTQSSSSTMGNNEAKVPFEAKYFDIPSGYRVVSDIAQGPYDTNGGSADPVVRGQWPEGIAVFGDGEKDDNGCKGWSYTTPVFTSPSQLQIKLYCHSGSNFLCQRGVNTCNVTVRVCAKVTR